MSLCPGKAFDFSISLYLFSTSSLVRFGGRGGKLERSKIGACTLLESNEVCRELGVFGTPFDNVEIVEMVDEIDSLEAFLPRCCSGGLRGGKAGEGCVELFLTGSLGGGGGADFVGWSIFWPVRTMFVGGGSTPFLLPLGSLPIPLLLDILSCLKV